MKRGNNDKNSSCAFMINEKCEEKKQDFIKRI